MDELLPSLRWQRLAILAGLLLILAGCQASSGRSAPVPVAAHASPEAMSSLTNPPSAPATADPTLTATPPPAVSPSATLPATLLPSTSLPSNSLGTGGTSIVELPGVSTAEPPAANTAEPPAATASATPVSELPVAPFEGARAPDFALTDLNGEQVSLSDLRGQPVLLNFWTTW